MESVEAVVIGAGVVGLAVARELAMKGLETLVTESGPTYGQGVSSRNSEVIHAGLYYRTGSLKAQLCLPGREMLYAYCSEKHVSTQQVGKWIVATSADEVDRLDDIHAQAIRNGCHEVYFMEGDEARRIEPQLQAHKVLVSPRTGIVDSHGLMTALLGDLEGHGGIVAYQSPVTGIQSDQSQHTVSIGGDTPMRLACKYLVNAAGLEAVNLAGTDDDFPKALLPNACYAKGNYFSLAGKSPFQRLIYPIPTKGGLGIHLTLDLQGRTRFGPDVEWVDNLNYEVDPLRVERFAKAIKTYWPTLDASRLAPDYSGIRPKLGDSNQFADDFLPLGPAQHGREGLLHLLGIESPGLTCCLSLAKWVSKTLLGK